MKKLLLALCAVAALTTAVSADNTATNAVPKKAEMTADQKALMKEMLAKYDTNKDGKLSKDERAAMSAEDKAKMEKAGLVKPKKTAPAASTN